VTEHAVRREPLELPPRRSTERAMPHKPIDEVRGTGFEMLRWRNVRHGAKFGI